MTARIQGRSSTAGHDVRDAGSVRVPGAKRHGPLVVVFVPADCHLYAGPLEDRIEGVADVEGGAMFAAGTIRRPMEQRDFPRLLRRGEVRLQPRELRRPPRRIEERVLGIEGNDVDRAVVEAVVALGMIRIACAGAVGRQHEQPEIRQSVAVVRTAVVIAVDGEHGSRAQPVAVDREKPVAGRLERAGAGPVRSPVSQVPRMQREVETLVFDQRVDVLLVGRTGTAVAERDERDRPGPDRRRGPESV